MDGGQKQRSGSFISDRGIDGRRRPKRERVGVVSTSEYLFVLVLLTRGLGLELDLALHLELAEHAIVVDDHLALVELLELLQRLHHFDLAARRLRPVLQQLSRSQNFAIHHFVFVIFQWHHFLINTIHSTPCTLK